MKNSYSLEKLAPEHLKKIMQYDHAEIDNPKPHAINKLNYWDRIQTVIDLIEKNYPNPTGIHIAELGCAQGNMSLLLAEKGYGVTAVDQNEKFLEYSRLKYEKGDLQWIQANFSEANIPIQPVDVAILGEIIEHCAYPEKVIENILSYVKPGGICIITTPNGSRIKAQLPSFKQVLKKYPRDTLAQKQFGPDGSDHLFLFTLKEAQSIMPQQTKLLESGYLGGSILIHASNLALIAWLRPSALKKTLRFLAKIPVINKRTFNNFYLIFKKVN
jgi:2-polyprenyl-3-methyl-5-hydroxy-6-metoxy-1,4-benzoquinol methylase